MAYTDTLWKNQRRNTANVFRRSCQQRSTRGSKNVRHVWTSLSQSSATLSLEEKTRRGREKQKGRAGLKGKGGRRRGGSEGAWRSHLEDLQWKATEDKAIRLGSPDSKVYWHLLITNRSLCMVSSASSHTLYSNWLTAAALSERGPLNKPALSWLGVQRFCP